MMNLNQFDGIDLELGGAYYGFRSFAIDDQARLHSPSQDDFVWKPGINLALDPYSQGQPVRLFEEDNGSGFYSYHGKGRAAIYAHQVRGRAVTGVIRNTGQILLGRDGMRSSEAAVVGIIKPGWAGGNQKRNWWWASFFSFVVPSMLLFAGLGWLLVGAVPFDTQHKVISGISGVSVMVSGFGLTIIALGTSLDMHSNNCSYRTAIMRWFAGTYFVKQHEARVARLAVPGPNGPDLFARFCELYPDVTVYRSLNKMAHAYQFEDPRNHEPAPPEHVFDDATASDFWEKL